MQFSQVLEACIENQQKVILPTTTRQSAAEQFHLFSE